MITTGIDKRVKVQQIIENQIPEFLLSESPKSVDFLKQYYISQEYQGGPIDLTDNLDQYIKLDNLTPEVVVGETKLTSGITTTDTTVNITSTQRSNNIIEIQAFPESNDIIGLKDLYLSFAVGDSSINMVKDTITSGEQISGVGYKVTSSYTNGALVRG